MRAAFEIGGNRIPAGTRATVELPVSVLANHMPVSLPVHVIHGRRPGPAIFLSAALHGDEIVGVEIIRRVLRSSALNKIAGTILAIPIVNVFGFLNQSRYLPDRRDLNRSFPGSERGSLAAQLADLFLTEVVRRCEFGIDLHSAAVHRMNLSQVRISPDSSPRVIELARAFGAPITLTASVREGSLRAAAVAKGAAKAAGDIAVAGSGLGFMRDHARDGFASRLGKPPRWGRIARSKGAAFDSGVIRDRRRDRLRCALPHALRARRRRRAAGRTRARPGSFRRVPRRCPDHACGRC
jgi:hypothetical protein